MIKTTIVTAAIMVYGYRWVLLKALALPLAILFVIELLAYSQTGWMASFIRLMQLPVHVIIAVTVHRIILLGEKSVPEWGIRNITSREINFLAKTLQLTLAWFLFFVSFMILLNFFLFLFTNLVGRIDTEYFYQFCFYVFYLAAVYLFARVSLVFPSIATDSPLTFQQSWNLTKPYRLYIFAVDFVAPSLFYLLSHFTSYLPYGNIFNIMLNLATISYFVAILSVAFKMIVPKP